MNRTKAKSHPKKFSKLKRNGFKQNDNEDISTTTKLAIGKNGLINGSVTEKCNNLTENSLKVKTENKKCESEILLNNVNSSNYSSNEKSNDTLNNEKDELNNLTNKFSDENNSNLSCLSNFENETVSRTTLNDDKIVNLRDGQEFSPLSYLESSAISLPSLDYLQSTSYSLPKEDFSPVASTSSSYMDSICMPSTSSYLQSTSKYLSHTKCSTDQFDPTEEQSDEIKEMLEKLEAISVSQENSDLSNPQKVRESDANENSDLSNPQNVRESDTNENSDLSNLQNVRESDLPEINYIQYESEIQMPMIMKIIQKDLSEPYSIYTYRYFIHNWPKLCFLAMCEDKCVGAIVCKLDLHRKVIRRGYIAMLAVDKNYRKRRIGSTLVRRAIEEMICGGADEVVLETEVTNKPALKLYEQLGFVRDKRLFRYYLNGVDALRLKLWLR